MDPRIARSGVWTQDPTSDPAKTPDLGGVHFQVQNWGVFGPKTHFLQKRQFWGPFLDPHFLDPEKLHLQEPRFLKKGLISGVGPGGSWDALFFHQKQPFFGPFLAPHFGPVLAGFPGHVAICAWLMVDNGDPCQHMAMPAKPSKKGIQKGAQIWTKSGILALSYPTPKMPLTRFWPFLGSIWVGLGQIWARSGPIRRPYLGAWMPGVPS